MTIYFIWLLALLSMLPLSPPQDSRQRSQGTRSPHGPLNIACDNCHTASAWKPIRNIPEFDHNRTKYPLLGMHAKIACMQCHTSPVFSNVGTKCADCHADIHKGQFGANCQQCHTVKGWRVSMQTTREHFNRFPLLGAHAALACDACHKSAAVGQFRGLSTDCYSCHAQVYAQATVPNHKALGFPTNCAACHTSMDTWYSAKFDHAKFAGFALTGAHATLDCTACHVGGKFQPMSVDCFSCHAKDYNGTNNPGHAASGIPTTCQLCHSTAAWSPATFDHNKTNFPLTGAHANLQCTACHIGGKFAGTPANCTSCHMKDYTAARNPDHVAGAFPTVCQECHTTTAWSPATFDHTTFTKFPLTGAHLNVPCTSCHINGKFAGTPTDCGSCHINDFNKTTNPNHVQLAFPTDCSICHTTATWANARFDHNKTGFPLTGAHTNLACATCHVNGNFNLTPGCSNCHLAAYNGTTNPNHKAAGFPLDCSICHSTSAWQPATFNHNSTGFPLTGAHFNLACASCHIGGKFAGTPADCYSCHKTEYQSTTSPNHVAAAFPTTCQTCHTTTSWLGATFNHTWFPIYSGSHAGKWTTCGDCHTNPSNYAVFSCITCHAHDKTTMDAAHTDVRNYVYNSSNCYACHPTGTGGG